MQESDGRKRHCVNSAFWKSCCFEGIGMERIVFNSCGKSTQYEMLIGTSLNEFGIEICRFLPCGRVFILTDGNVAPLFLEDVSAASVHSGLMFSALLFRQARRIKAA